MNIKYALEPDVSDAEAIRIYEAALRYYIAKTHVPATATIWVWIEGAPAPKELLSRFRGEHPQIAATSIQSPLHPFWCGLQLGTTTSEACHMLVNGIPGSGQHIYYLRNQKRNWKVMRDEDGYWDE